MRSRWRADTAPLKSGRCRDKSRSFNHIQTSLDLRYLPQKILIRYNRIEHWVHLRCASICLAQYTDTWTYHLHRESRLTPHTDITPPHPSRLWSKPTTHSPHTPPQHRNTFNTPPVPTGLVKPKANHLVYSPPHVIRRSEPNTYTFHTLHQLLSTTHHTHP